MITLDSSSAPRKLGIDTAKDGTRTTKSCARAKDLKEAQE